MVRITHSSVQKVGDGNSWQQEETGGTDSLHLCVVQILRVKTSVSEGYIAQF